jgi:transposase-like protein
LTEDTKEAGFWLNILVRQEICENESASIAHRADTERDSGRDCVSVPNIHTQHCIAHFVRNLLQFLSYEDNRSSFADLKANNANITKKDRNSTIAPRVIIHHTIREQIEKQGGRF